MPFSFKGDLLRAFSLQWVQGEGLSSPKSDRCCCQSGEIRWREKKSSERRTLETENTVEEVQGEAFFLFVQTLAIA